MSTPRVKTISKALDQFHGTYKGCDIHVWRDDPEDDWYIQVTPFGKSMLYDGAWHNSSDKAMDEAIVEALDGAMLNPRGQQ